MTDNIIEFPESERIEEIKSNKSFNFHKERLEKLLYEMQYEVFRLFQDKDYNQKEIHCRQIIPTHGGKNMVIKLDVIDYIDIRG